MEETRGRDWLLDGRSPGGEPSWVQNMLERVLQEEEIKRCFKVIADHLEKEMRHGHVNADEIHQARGIGNTGRDLQDVDYLIRQDKLARARCDDVEDLVVGPAVPHAYKSNVVTWVGFLVCSFIANYCTGIDDETGLASSPFIYVGFGAFLLLLWSASTAMSVWWELKAFTYVLVSQVSVVDVPRNLSVKSFLAILGSLSVLLHTDILTTAVFFGRVFKSTHSCNVEWDMAWFFGVDENSPLEVMWGKAVQNAEDVQDLPLPEAMKWVRFWQVTLIAWLCMVFQLVYALLYSVPTSPDFQNSGYPKYVLVEGDCVAEGFLLMGTNSGDNGPFERLRSEYDTLCVAGTGHGRCLQALADSGRMITVQWLDDAYQIKAAPAWTTKKLAGERFRANFRFLLFTIQGILMPNLQITYFGVLKARSPHAPGDPSVLASNLFMVVSIIISVVAGAKYIVWEVRSAWGHVNVIWERFSKNSYDMELTMEIREQGTLTDLHGRPPTRAQWEYNKFSVKGMFSMVYNVLLAILASLAFLYILTKVIMEMMVCDALWNVPDFDEVTKSTHWFLKPVHYLWNLQEGCVDFPPTDLDTHWNGGWKDCNTTYKRIFR